MADETKYETKSVQSVRGTEGIIVSKMQIDGWELVDQTQGRLKVTLNFRRPKKLLPKGTIAGGVAAALILTGIITVGAMGEEDEKEPAAAKPTPSLSEAPSPAPTTPQARQDETPSPSETPARPPQAGPITAKNSPEFAALLEGDYCDEANGTFAKAHAGEQIAFDGSVINVADLGDGTSDVTFGRGDKGPDTTLGPVFKFEGTDLALAGGEKYHFVVTVREWNEDTCLFFVAPGQTDPR